MLRLCSRAEPGTRARGTRELGAWGCPRLGHGDPHGSVALGDRVSLQRQRDSPAGPEPSARQGHCALGDSDRAWGGRGIPTAHGTPGDPWPALVGIPGWGRIGLGDPRPTQGVWGPGGATSRGCHWGITGCWWRVGDTRDPPIAGTSPAGTGWVGLGAAPQVPPRWGWGCPGGPGGRSRGALPGLGSGQGHGDTGSRESAGAARASSPLPSPSLSPSLSLSPPSLSLSPPSLSPSSSSSPSPSRC